MKKSQIILLWIFLAAGSASGQKGTIDAGIHTSLAMTRLCCGSTEATEGFYFQAAPGAGLNASMALSDHFSLATEISFTRIKSMREGFLPVIPGNIPGIPADKKRYGYFSHEVLLDYLEVPLLIRAAAGGKLKAYLAAGPFIGFLLKSRYETKGQGMLYEDNSGKQPARNSTGDIYPEQSFDARGDMNDALRSVNLGACESIGLIYAPGKNKFRLETRYSLGLMDIRKNKPGNGSNKTDVLSIQLSYTVPL